MWTSTLELTPAKVIPTKILGRFWRGAYFSSFAPLRVQNLPRQPLSASNWVRVRNSLAGICGSDLHLIFADGDFRVAPAAIPSHSLSYPGHEVVGEVIEVGQDVESLQVGDRVVLQHGPNCHTAGLQPLCRSCASGHYGLCERGPSAGPEPFGGGWSEEMLLHEHQLFRIPPTISDMQAVLLEPSAVAVHAVLRYLPQAGERVLIIGSGTIGLLILQVVRALAPEAEVSVLARHAFQIEQAARMDAKIIYPEDSYKEVQEATDAKLFEGMFGNKMLLGGFDVIYDTVGSRQTTHDALRWARAGSTVVMVGVSLHNMYIDLTPIWYQEVNLIGTMGHGMENWPIGTMERKSTFAVTTELIEKRRLFPDKLVTHRFALSEYRNALITASDKTHNRAIKVVFDYSKQPPAVVPNAHTSPRQRPRAITGPDMHPSQSQPLDSQYQTYTPVPTPPLTPTPYPQRQSIPMPEPPVSVPPAPSSFIPTTPPLSYSGDLPDIDSEPIFGEEEDEYTEKNVVPSLKHTWLQEQPPTSDAFLSSTEEDAHQETFLFERPEPEPGQEIVGDVGMEESETAPAAEIALQEANPEGQEEQEEQEE